MARKFKVQQAEYLEPRTMLLYSLPKTGKTQALSALPDALILDFDDGASYYKNMRVVFKGNTIDEKYTNFVNAFKEIAEDVKENGKYKFIVIDTVTALYDELANALAVVSYNAENNKNLPLDYDMTKLSYGLGYAYKREAIKKIINRCLEYADHVIIVGHVGDKSVNKETKAIEVADVDLEGKFKNILALKMDAVGLMYRAEQNENHISFVTSTLLLGGARASYLRNKDFVISKMLDNGTLETYWENIFPSLKQNQSN